MKETTLTGIIATIWTAAIFSSSILIPIKEPFHINGVNYRGCENDKWRGVQLVYFGDRETGIVNKDRKFNVDKEHQQGEFYNVTGYKRGKTFYATNIMPARVESILKKEAY